MRKITLYPNKIYNWYGVRWDITQQTTLMERTGDMVLHRTLPIQSKMKRCILLENGNVNYYLYENDSTLKADGVTPSKTDGTDGDVMVEIPEHWIKFISIGNIREVRISENQLSGFTRVPKRYVSAYEATVQRSTNKLVSVASLDADYRGGNNNAAWDSQANSLLGIPASSIRRYEFRDYARNKGSINWNMMLHRVRKSIFWLYMVEYANKNSQTAYSPVRDQYDFMTGGLGYNIVTSQDWLDFNSRQGFIPCGFSNSSGNNTDVKPFDVSVWDTNYNSFNCKTYRGIENVFQHLWEWTDGINVRIQADNAGGKSEVFVANSLNMSDTDYTDYTNMGEIPRSNHYISELLFTNGEIMPKEKNGSSNTYWSDYFYTTIPSSGESLRGVLSGGLANDGSTAGLGCSATHTVPAYRSATVGSRLCFLPEGI